MGSPFGSWPGAWRGNSNGLALLRRPGPQGRAKLNRVRRSYNLTDGAFADAGSIPAASTFPANRDSGLEHLVTALPDLEKGLGEVSRVELRVARRRANVGVPEQELGQA